MGLRIRNSVEDINRKKPASSKLTAIRLASPCYGVSGKFYARVRCRCSCGKAVVAIVDSVIRGGTKSCGCSRRKPNIALRSKYPLHLRKVYQGILDRCYNKKHRSYPTYGGRGVTVCEEWRKEMSAFCEWALANGWEKGLQIDKDIKGGKLYGPETCVIATSQLNNNNRRSNRRMLFEGEEITLAEISRRTGYNNKSLYDYVSRHKRLPF